jgi:hypothetical protein
MTLEAWNMKEWRKHETFMKHDAWSMKHGKHDAWNLWKHETWNETWHMET